MKSCIHSSFLYILGVMGKLALPKMENKTVHAGQTAIFSCELLNVASSGWSHGEDLVYLRGNVKPVDFSTFDSHYSFENPGSTGTQRMSIHNVSASDIGSITCFGAINLDDGWSTSIAYLTVLVPPKNVTVAWSALHREGSVIRMDETVNLTCLAYDGQPRPKLIWYRGSKQVSGRHGRSFFITLAIKPKDDLEHH